MAGRRRNPWAGFGVALVMVAVIVVEARLALRTPTPGPGRPTGCTIRGRLAAGDPAAARVVLEDLLARERNALVQRLTPEARDQAIRDARRLAG